MYHSHRTQKNPPKQKKNLNYIIKNLSFIRRILSIILIPFGVLMFFLQSCGTTESSKSEKSNFSSPEQSPFYGLYDQSYSLPDANSTPVKLKGAKK